MPHEIRTPEAPTDTHEVVTRITEPPDPKVTKAIVWFGVAVSVVMASPVILLTVLLCKTGIDSLIREVGTLGEQGTYFTITGGLLLAVLIIWGMRKIRGKKGHVKSHPRGGGEHHEFLGNLKTVLVCTLLIIGIASCSMQALNTQRMMAGWRAAEAVRNQQTTLDRIGITVWKTNFVLQAGERAQDIFVPGTLRYEYDAPGVTDVDVIRQYIYFNRAPTTNGYVIVPIMTNEVGFLAHIKHDRNTDHIERLISRAPHPIRIGFAMGN
jgi:hypothetical protein